MSKNIKLPEHNSSRLLFVDNDDAELVLNELEQVSSDIEKDRCTEGGCKFLLGKLSDHTWILEDCGIYDSNHTHRAEIINTTSNEVAYNVTRIMEYSQECDRLYTEHSGSIKFILLDSPSEDLYANFYIKYERALPSAVTRLGNITIDGNVFQGCILFYNYNSNNQLVIQEAVQISGGLQVTNELDQPVNYMNYCSLTIKDVILEFGRISIKYNINPNNSNSVKIGMIGTISPYINSQNNYYGKFNSSRYYTENDSLVEPSYFIIQAPKNRSWICYRECYEESLPGSYNYEYDDNNNYVQHTKNDCPCYFINKEGAALNGYNGTLNNGHYEYTINIDRNRTPYLFMLPEIFWNYQSIEYFGSNDNVVSYDGGPSNPIKNIYNELDGIFYKQFTIVPSSQIFKIKITY